MNITHCFELLIEHAKKANLPKGFQADIVLALNYFKVQSLCDIDRRESPAKLRAAWTQLKNQTRGLNFFESFKDGDENFWRIVKCFVYEVEPSSLIIPIPERPPSKVTSKYDHWQPQDFFLYLSKEIEGRVQFTEAERSSILHGLWYLQSEASKGRGQRNEDRMKRVWKTIHPNLEKVGMLSQFKNEEKLISSIKFFIERVF